MACAFDDALFFKTRIENLFDIVKERSLDCAPFYRQLERMYPEKRFIALTSQRVSVLERFQKIIDFGKIKEFISVADKPYSKKDVLRESEKYLGVPQEKCVIFEDFAPTLHAAMDCGVYAVGISHDFNALDESDYNVLFHIHKEIEFS